jgi:hypothetical protein
VRKSIAFWIDLSVPWSISISAKRPCRKTKLQKELLFRDEANNTEMSSNMPY